MKKHLLMVFHYTVWPKPKTSPLLGARDNNYSRRKGSPTTPLPPRRFLFRFVSACLGMAALISSPPLPPKASGCFCSVSGVFLMCFWVVSVMFLVCFCCASVMCLRCFWGTSGVFLGCQRVSVVFLWWFWGVVGVFLVCFWGVVGLLPVCFWSVSDVSLVCF